MPQFDRFHRLIGPCGAIFLIKLALKTQNIVMSVCRFRFHFSILHAPANVCEVNVGVNVVNLSSAKDNRLFGTLLTCILAQKHLDETDNHAGSD